MHKDEFFVALVPTSIVDTSCQLFPDGLLKHDIATSVHKFYHYDIQLVVGASIERIEFAQHLFSMIVVIDKCFREDFIVLPVES